MYIPQFSQIKIKIFSKSRTQLRKYVKNLYLLSLVKRNFNYKVKINKAIDSPKIINY